MATIIDSLLVTLGLDTSGFSAGKSKVDKGLKDTGANADEAGKKLQGAGKKGSDSFKELALGATKFLAIIGGVAAVKQFAAHVIESSAALDRMAQNLQRNVSEISAWSNAAEQAGGSAEGLQGTLDMLSKEQTQLMLTGESGLIPYFSALGIAIADADGKARAGSDILLQLADRFSSMDRTSANNMGRMMGIDQGTMNLLLKGRTEVELMIVRQKEYGAVTKEQAEQSSKLRRAMIESRQSFEAFGRQIVIAAAPAILKFFEVLKGLGDWVRENKDFIAAFFTVIAAAIAVYYTPAIIAAAVATWALIAPMLAAAAPILALAAAIGFLWDDYQTWKRGGDSLIDWDAWEPGINAAKNAISYLKDLLGDLMYRAIAAADVLSAVFSKDWKRAKYAIGEVVNGNGVKYGEEGAKGQTWGPDKPAAMPTVNSTGSAPPASSNAAMAYFMKQGWSREQAAGLAANIQRESAGKADAVGDSGSAYGLAQWHPDRQAAFKKKFGEDIKGSTAEEQMAFMQYELTEGSERGAGARLRGATSAADAGGIVSSYYERPGDKEGEASKRGALAASLMGIPGASRAARDAQSASVARVSSPGTAGGNTEIQNHIGKIEVHTAATDAAGIAADISKSMDYALVSQANYGL